ncbi:hypothetical protein IMY05_009G0033000 [Salix suchowensis]|nr:hypothetical protein IMY05_009G0033000 [Salix suchowensis]
MRSQVYRLKPSSKAQKYAALGFIYKRQDRLSSLFLTSEATVCTSLLSFSPDSIPGFPIEKLFIKSYARVT